MRHVHHLPTAQQLMTGPAVLALLLLVAAVAGNILLFLRSFSPFWRRVLVVTNFVSLVLGTVLLWHNHDRLQASPLIGIALGVAAVSALAGLCYLSWANWSHLPLTTPMGRRRRRSLVLLGALIVLGGLIASTLLLAETQTTWHWT